MALVCFEWQKALLLGVSTFLLACLAGLPCLAERQWVGY